MHGLDATARRLVAAGFAPRFELPRPWPPPEGRPDKPGELLESRALKIQELLSREGVADDTMAELERQRQGIAAWRDRTQRILRRRRRP
jgi:hypothetical protein